MKKAKFLALLMAVAIIFSIFSGCSKNAEVKKPEEKTQVKETVSDAEKDEEESKYNVKVNDSDVTFTDDRGQEVTIKKNPKRVVCLYNSYLDIWDKCGGTVIGRVQEAEEKPVENAVAAEEVGTSSAPSLEKILALQPDLVIMTSAYKAQKEMISTLEQSNIQVISLKNEFKKDYFETVKLFTAITGKDDLYEKNAKTIKNGIDDIVAKAPKDKNYKALILFASAKNLTVRDSNTMVGEMLKDLNVVNIADSEDKSADTKTFSMEKIIQEDPDFIFVQTMGSDKEKIMERLKQDAEDNPAWASLKAVKEGRYVILPKDLYMYKPNDRYAEAYEGLAKILYPEVFK